MCEEFISWVPFPIFGFVGVLVVVDYVSKWVKALNTSTNDHKVVKEYIFCRYETSKALISDEGSHFCHQSFEVLLGKYSMNHKVSTPYRRQTSHQVEVSNQRRIQHGANNIT